jgi:hypothetical protein
MKEPVSASGEFWQSPLLALKLDPGGLFSPQKGSDCLSTFLAGSIGLIVLGSLLILILSWIF